MELKLGMLINSQEIIQNLSKGKFKAKVTWRLTGIIKSMEEYVNKFHDIRNDLIKKYGEDVDGVVSVNPDSENFKNFITELNEVAEEDITLNVKKISIDDIEDFEITIEDLIKIDWLISE